MIEQKKKWWAIILSLKLNKNTFQIMIISMHYLVFMCGKMIMYL